jgi:hypothetical protein
VDIAVADRRLRRIGLLRGGAEALLVDQPQVAAPADAEAELAAHLRRRDLDRLARVAHPRLDDVGDVGQACRQLRRHLERLAGAERHAGMRHARAALDVADTGGNGWQDEDQQTGRHEKHPEAIAAPRRCAR